MRYNGLLFSFEDVYFINNEDKTGNSRDDKNIDGKSIFELVKKIGSDGFVCNKTSNIEIIEISDSKIWTSVFSDWDCCESIEEFIEKDCKRVSTQEIIGEILSLMFIANNFCVSNKLFFN